MSQQAVRPGHNIRAPAVGSPHEAQTPACWLEVAAVPEEAALALAPKQLAVLFPLPSLHPPRQTRQPCWDLQPLYRSSVFPASTGRLYAGNHMWLHG